MSTKEINEMSGMGAGAVEGAPSSKKRIFREESYVKREDIVKELMLRQHIQESLKETFINKFNEWKNNKKQEMGFRTLLREYILKEKKDVEKDPHASTGINVLEELLKKIIPSLEEDYKTLTTSEAQRKSFRAHILKAIQQTLDTQNINQGAGGVEPLKENVLDDNINIKVAPEEDGKFIDINKKGKEAAEPDTFSIAGEDETGRNMAKASFDKIEKNIIDAYSVLSDESDKKLFYDYLMTNITLYFNKFEDELSNSVEEPLVGKEEPGAESLTSDQKSDTME